MQNPSTMEEDTTQAREPDDLLISGRLGLKRVTPYATSNPRVKPRVTLGLGLAITLDME